LAVNAGAISPKRSGAVLTNLDVVFVIVVAPVAIALGAPKVGAIVGAAAWVLQRVIQELDKRWVGRFRKPQQVLAANLGEAFGRTWLLAGAIVAAGLAAHRKDGLTAGLIIISAYTVAFVIRIIAGKQREREHQAAQR
jgi:hypothetical protein